MTLEHRNHARCACASALSSAEALASARPFALAGVKRVYERPRPFVIQHVSLDLALDLKAKAVSGTARLEVLRVDATATEICLDAVGFEIAAVEVLVSGGTATRGAKAKGKQAKPAGARDFEAARYQYDGESLRVALSPKITAASVRVRYRAVPRRGLYFLEPDEHVRDRPRQVWTQLQDEDARHLFPCHDKPHVKQTTELRVKVPAGWFALSNGALVSAPREHKVGTYHWRMDEPHPSYLVTLAAGEFAEIEDTVDGVPLTYYVPKGREADGKRTFARTPEMIRRFGELTGVPYPWNKYAQVVVSDFIFGGMENTTATTMYEHILLDPRAAIDVSSDDLIAHELAHQWFGDFVTCRDWSHAWLNEGFATFMEHIDREGHLGRDEYDYHVKHDLETYVAEARGRYRRPIVCHDYEAPIDIFDRHLYEKGGCVLHLLRRELGDDIFWKGVNRYLTQHARGVVETRDLMRALEEVSGKSLERFFEQWVYRAGHPELDVEVEHEAGVCTVTVKQTQAGAAGAPSAGGAAEAATIFAFDLTIDLGLAEESASRGGTSRPGGVRREVRRVDQATHTFAFPAPTRPRFVVIDPELTVLGEIRVDAPGDMLRAQLTEAPTPRGRMLATAGLSKLDDPATVKALGRVVADEDEFWGARAEAVAALGTLRSEEAFAVLADNVKTRHPKVRRAVVHALGKFRTARAADVLRKVALKDASYLVEAEAARALGATRQASALETLVEILDRPSWADVIRAGAIDGLAALRDERALPHVTSRTRYGVSTRGRRAAILALPRLSSDRRTRETLEDLLDASDPYLRVDVVRAIGELGDAKSRAALHRQLDRELDGRVRRRIREVLRDLGGAAKRETDRLRDELESLRGEHADLKSRLGKLEDLAGAPAKGRGAKGGDQRPREQGAKGGDRIEKAIKAADAAAVAEARPKGKSAVATGTSRASSRGKNGRSSATRIPTRLTE
jgi:aminopeptidase N